MNICLRDLKGLVFILLFTFVYASCDHKKSYDFTIAVASNAVDPVNELEQAFFSQTGLRANIVSSSSGNLHSQILSGAPYNIFLSADMSYAQDLSDKDLSLDKAPTVYAQGKLVLAYPSSIKMEDISQLNKLQRIAIANVNNAPYGRAAKEYLQEKGMFEELKKQFVFAENVSQCNQFLYTGAVDGIFTSLSSMEVLGKKHGVEYLLIDEELYTPIDQGMVVIKGKEKEKEESAIEFFHFITSEEGKKILRKYGYTFN